MRFHQAAEAGTLDPSLPPLRLLDLDLDRDGDRIRAIGCSSQYIPLFAQVTAEGRCDPNRRLMGGVKGEGAAAQVAGRLKSLVGPG